MNEPSLKECYANTDLEWRLRQIPDSASCRGVYFNMLDERAAEFGPVVQGAYRDFFKTYKFSPLRLFSVKDYLTRMLMLANIQFGGPKIYRGVYELQSATWPAWRRTVMGRATLSILGTEFHAILKMVRSTARMSVNYSKFELEGGPTQYITHHVSEYNYIEHAMAGGVAGIARVCGVHVDIEPRLKDPFNGSLHITVSPLQQAVAS